MWPQSLHHAVDLIVPADVCLYAQHPRQLIPPPSVSEGRIQCIFFGQGRLEDKCRGCQSLERRRLRLLEPQRRQLVSFPCCTELRLPQARGGCQRGTPRGAQEALHPMYGDVHTQVPGRRTTCIQPSVARTCDLWEAPQSRHQGRHLNDAGKFDGPRHLLCRYDLAVMPALQHCRASGRAPGVHIVPANNHGSCPGHLHRRRLLDAHG
mmetsp:Transcript_52078/g.132476  ORF Transcript_52078/g.132476 Transcript_52078/m.132476 type:complete len:208 (+) Transcript_52078:696-1319(+)